MRGGVQHRGPQMSIKRVTSWATSSRWRRPDIRPSEKAENKVDVTFKVEEQNRNQFTFGGGVSGYEGRSSTQLLDLQLPRRRRDGDARRPDGSRTKNYQLSITEPYFLDRPSLRVQHLLQPPDLLSMRRRWATAADQGISLTAGSCSAGSRTSTRATPTRSSTLRRRHEEAPVSRDLGS